MSCVTINKRKFIFYFFYIFNIESYKRGIDLWSVIKLMDKNKEYVLIIGLVALAIATIIYFFYIPPFDNKCGAGDSGSCLTDKDCNGPISGKCYKDKNGVCGCVCADGFSGSNCEIKGVLASSPHCVGPNKAYPPSKSKTGLCICPAGAWESGHDPTYGYVQCLKCGSGYGPKPYGGDNACQLQWGSATYLSNDCYGVGSSYECNEYNGYLSQTGPSGLKGENNTLQTCGSLNTNSCRCDSTMQDPLAQSLCRVTGWLKPGDDGKVETCSTVSKERPCNSYNCYFES